MEITALLFNSIGIIGVALVLLAYFLLEHETVNSHSMLYLLLNLLGSILIIISLFWDWNLPGFLINTAWVFTSLYGMWKTKKAKKGKKIG